MKSKINFNRENINKLICYAILIFMTIIVFSPIIYAFLTSFMSNRDIMAGRLFPETFSFENYKVLKDKIPIGTFFYNSLVVSILGMIFQIITCSLAAYAMVFIDFKGKKECTYLYYYLCSYLGKRYLFQTTLQC